MIFFAVKVSKDLLMLISVKFLGAILDICLVIFTFYQVPS